MKTIGILKKISILLLFCIVLTYSSHLNAQIRLIEVNPSANTVTIKNFGTSMVSISNYWFCSLFNYNQLNTLTIDSGSLNLTSGATVKFSGVNLRDSDADLGLYTTNTFGVAAAMEDFMQWGDAGNGRESVANTANIWTTGNFLAGSGPFIYNGNGSQNGVSFWQTGTLHINDDFLNATLSIYPNPTTKNLIIKKTQNIELNKATIYDIAGRLLNTIDLTKTTVENKISLNTISKGIYFIRITDNNSNTVTKRFVKE